MSQSHISRFWNLSNMVMIVINSVQGIDSFLAITKPSENFRANTKYFIVQFLMAKLNIANLGKIYR